MYNYYYGYNYPMGYGKSGFFTAMIVALILAVIVSVVWYFVFMARKNEGKHKGFLGKVYNFLNFNRFYIEDIIRFLNVLTIMVCLFAGIILLCYERIALGLCIIIVGNLMTRIIYELIMMYVIKVRKTVSIDRRLSKIEEAYDMAADREIYCPEEDFECEEYCEEEKEPEFEVEYIYAGDPEAEGTAATGFEECSASGSEEAFEENSVEENSEEGCPSEGCSACAGASGCGIANIEKLMGENGEVINPYGYDEECTSCENWDEVSQDCYCPDDCITCEKANQ